MNSKKLLLALTLAGSVASSASAAALIFTTPINLTFAEIEGTSRSLNLDGGADEFVFTRINDGGANIIQMSVESSVVQIVRDPPPFPSFPSLQPSKASNLGLGESVMSATLYAPSASNPFFASDEGDVNSNMTGFSFNTPGYIAFSFMGSAGTQYGWAQLTFSETGLTIGSYGYETLANTDILVGAGSPVPEPSAYGVAASLMVLGLVGFRRLRRK